LKITDASNNSIKLTHQLSGQENNSKVTTLDENATLDLTVPAPTATDNYRSYLDLAPFQIILDKIKGRETLAQATADSYQKAAGKVVEDEVELETRIIKLEADKAKLQQTLNEIKTADFDSLKTKFKGVYGAGPGNKKYTKWEVIYLENGLKQIQEMATQKNEQLDAYFVTAENEMTRVFNPAAIAERDISFLLAKGKTNKEKVGELTASSLNVYRGYFTTVSVYRELEEEEKTLLKAIEDKLSGKDEPDESPTSDLTGPTLLNLLGAKTGTAESAVNLDS